MGGGEARELHRDAGQHMHGWEPGGAQICKGGFNSYSYSAQFYKSGDPQAEERFKLNAKVGKKKTRGAKVSMMVMMTQA